MTSALLLLKEGYDVTVIGQYIPGDSNTLYTSPKAGANWSSFASNDDIVMQNFDKPGYYEFLRLAKEEPESGIHQVYTNFCLTEKQAPEYEVPWFQYLVQDFQKLNPEDYLNKMDIAKIGNGDKFVGGHRFATVTITTPRYLTYLYNQILKLGGSVRRTVISHIDEARKLHHSQHEPDLIVNCTGLSSRTLGGVNDKNIYPVKGQIVVLSNTCTDQYIIEGISDGIVTNEVFYLFPREEGGCIVGGMYMPVDPNDTGSETDPELTKRILKRAEKYVPELLSNEKFKGNKPYLDVITEYVGYRPARKGGIRLEREGNIIHNYGAGGAGYQSSYGTAAGVVKLANDWMKNVKKSKL